MTLDEKLSKLYLELKNGDSRGIKVDDDDLYHLAINKGFAIKSKMLSYGNTHKAMLTELGKQFETYEQFLNRHKPLSQPNIQIEKMIGSPFVQGDFLGNFESNHNSKDLVNVEEIVKPIEEPNTTQKKLSIFQKIYKWTDHKLISNIIIGILGFLASLLANYLGWIPCMR